VTRRGREDVVASDTCTWLLQPQRCVAAFLPPCAPSPQDPVGSGPAACTDTRVISSHAKIRISAIEIRAAGRPTPSRGRRRRARPGPPGSTFEVQLVGGEEGRRLEQQQTEAIIEVLAWLAAYPRPAPTTATRSAATLATKRSTTASTDTNAATNATTRTGRTGSGDALPSTPTSSSYPTAVRVRAVGLVGAGQPLREVACALGVHPAALRRRVLQTWRRWAAAAGLPDSPAPSRCPDDDQK
jgi:hypothetical protein